MGCGPLQVVCHALGSAAGDAASAGLGAVADSFGKAAATLCDWAWSTIAATTTVDLTGGWFRSDLGLTATLAGVLVTALFALQLIKAGLRRDPGALLRAVTGCGLALVGASAAILVTEVLLALTDQLADGVVRVGGDKNLAAMGRELTPVTLLSGGQFTPALVIVVSVLFVIASVLVWAVFLVRKALLVVAAVFAPIAFAGAAADGTRAWVRRWIEFTLTMIFAKLVIVVIFTVAVSLLAEPGTGSGSASGGLSNLLTGGLLLLLAGFAPFLVFKLVHYIGGDVAAAHHSAVLSDGKAAAGAAAAPMALRHTATKVFAGARSGTGAGAGAGAAAGTGAAAVAGPAAAGTAVVDAVKLPTRAATTLSDRIPTPDTVRAPGSSPPGAAAAPTPATSAPAATSAGAGAPGPPAPGEPAGDPPARHRLPVTVPSLRGVDWSEAT